MVWLRRIVAFMLAVAVTSALGAALHTQFVVASVTGLGHPVAFGDRLVWTAHDVASMFPTFAPIIAFAFLLAFPVAALVSRRLPNLRTIGYVLAGALALFCALLVMKQLLDISGVAGARTTAGLLAQAAAGAVGGWVFAMVSRARVD
jgi:hypothetical protein